MGPTFRRPAFDFSFPQGWEPIEQALCRAFPSESQGLKSFLTQVRALWEQTRTLFVRHRNKNPEAAFPSVGRSLQETLDGWFVDVLPDINENLVVELYSK